MSDNAIDEVVAIDGPAGVGKSTAAAAVALRLGWLFVNTGSLYRTVVVMAGIHSIPLDDETALVELILAHRITIPGPNRVRVHNAEYSEQIRAPEISMQTPLVARLPKVRQAITELTKQMVADAPGAVLEGRDIGTVVFPNARYKFWLMADVAMREERIRLMQMERGVPADQLAAQTEEILERDRIDAQRTTSPMKKADGAIAIDSSHLSKEEVVAHICLVVQAESDPVQLLRADALPVQIARNTPRGPIYWLDANNKPLRMFHPQPDK